MIRNTLLGLSLLAAAAAFAQDAKTPLYTVVDGYKVDENTMKGFRTWRQAACDRCHGANQEGLVGPSLVNSLKTLTKDEFVKTVRDGRLEKGMQSFGTSQVVMDNIDFLYAYLKGRSDGAITRAKVEPLVGAIRRALKASGVPVESSKGEWGPGQHELNVLYAPFLEMCDRHVIYKQAAKEIGTHAAVAGLLSAVLGLDHGVRAVERIEAHLIDGLGGQPEERGRSIAQPAVGAAEEAALGGDENPPRLRCCRRSCFGRCRASLRRGRRYRPRGHC